MQQLSDSTALDLVEARGDPREGQRHQHRGHDHHQGRRPDQPAVASTPPSRPRRPASTASASWWSRARSAASPIRSAVATLDIEQMVRQMQAAVSAGVMEMDKFTEEVRRGVATVGDINSQLGQIIEQVQSLSSRIDSVNEGMRSQSHRRLADQRRDGAADRGRAPDGDLAQGVQQRDRQLARRGRRACAASSRARAL